MMSLEDAIKENTQSDWSALNDGTDVMMYQRQKGEWKLIAPDGTMFVGGSPLRCVRAEINYRVPKYVQLQRLYEALD